MPVFCSVLVQHQTVLIAVKQVLVVDSLFILERYFLLNEFCIIFYMNRTVLSKTNKNKVHQSRPLTT